MKLDSTSNWSSPQVELFLLEPRHVGPEYLDWLTDPMVNQYLESRFATHTMASICDFVNTCLIDPNTLFLGIRSKALDGRHVGNIKISPIDRKHGLGEVGILIGDRSAWGRGIASEAISIMSPVGHPNSSTFGHLKFPHLIGA
ncbi:GNAT family N-acetyltransferase [Eoetvoesiella caeni]